jgi:hypothetical protein
MGALTKVRPGGRRDGGYVTLKVDAGVIIYGGAIVVTGAEGLARPGYSETGLTVWGRATETVDNSGGAAGAKSVQVELSKGTKKFQFENDLTGTPLTQMDVGKPAYVLDDQTLTADSTGRSHGGTIVIGVEGSKVWMMFAR